MEKREKPVVGLGHHHLARKHKHSSSPPPTAAAGCNGKEKEGGDHKAVLRQKKLKAKTFKWRSSSRGMDSKVEAVKADHQVYDDTVICSQSSTNGSSSLISWKKVRTLGKVAEQCDAVDPPVPRKLRSAINKRVGRFVSASPRHVKKKRHLSAISAQISFVDQETRSNGSSLFTEEEEAIADVLMSLSQIPSHSELTADKVVADSSNTNVASTSCSEGPTKEGDQTIILPTASNKQVNQSACIDKGVEQTSIVPNVIPVAADQSNNETPPLSANDQIQELSLETVVNLPSPSKDTSNNRARKQQKVQFDDSKCHAQNPEAPLWLVNSHKSEASPHEREKVKNNSAQETALPVQTPFPCTPARYLIKPSSSKLQAARANTISESANFTAPGNQNKQQHPLVKSVGAPKAWKRSITHVYVSHVIQMHVNKEKAASSSQSQAKPEERRLIVRSSRPPNGAPALHKAITARDDDKFYTVHFDVRVPAHQPPQSAGICGDMGAAGRQKMVNGGFLNLPTTSAAAAAAQHVQYLHPQMAPPRDATSYSFPHLPYSRGGLAPAAALQQMPQYMCGPGYGQRAGGVPASSPAMMMKQLQQLVPSQQQQQQMMWQYHVSQYQARRDATASPAAAWHGMSSLLRPTMGMVAAVPRAMPPQQQQMELFCAPYQGGGTGGGRQPQQLRLM